MSKQYYEVLYRSEPYVYILFVSPLYLYLYMYNRISITVSDTGYCGVTVVILLYYNNTVVCSRCVQGVVSGWKCRMQTQ